MERAANKAERLLQMEQLLLAHPEGLHRAEIARRLGVHRSTVGRDIDTLALRVPIWEHDKRLGINRDDYRVDVRVTLHEAMAFHLAARLMTTRSDKQNPHAGSALRKLGHALEELAPLVSRHLLASADVMDDAARRHDPVYLEALETLTRAWSLGRKVHLSHRMPDGRVFEYDFAPYFIEPYAVGRTSHVIGWREPPGAVRTFKLERIQRIELTDATYAIPDNFDPRELLADAWGIWYTEEEPVEVVLRFHPRVAHRVRETRWHRSQSLEEQPDGSLIWRAQVAEPQEMVPWVRGWGADVEVVGPEELRNELEAEARRLALVYGVEDISPPPLYQRLWAKADKETGRSHALICHLIDVSQVALTMWREVLTAGMRGQFADALRLSEDAAGRLIAFWAGLHDLGKATPGFQRKYAPARAELEEEGLEFPKVYGRQSFYHGTASAVLLSDLLKCDGCLGRARARSVGAAVGGHHGAWPIPREIMQLRTLELGDEDWASVQHSLLKALDVVCEPPSVEPHELSPIERNAFLTLLSGLTSVADWIGSMERYFPFVEAPIDEGKYADRAVRQARHALTELNWIGWHPPDEARTFETLFDLAAARPMQKQAIELAEELDRPALVIIEAPTGVGKTEAALYLADHWARTRRQRGLYVAMPTMATSNQMFGRVSEMLNRRYPGMTVEPLLVHSQARWSPAEPPPEVHISHRELHDTEQEVNSMAWFLPRKRSLLAPLGVGTVDQTFFSVLQTRHFFVRLFGLSHKTLIFDEVHAYDTYMCEIFHRLLGWLRAVEATVVILSATLPERTRRRLLEAYAGVPEEEVPESTYPAITWGTEGKVGVIPVESSGSRTITLEWIDRDPGTIVSRLTDALREGGCAAVICNTVGRAQDVYRALRDAALVSDENLILFHARFPSAWRDEIESDVLSRFGKGGNRPEKAVVVATQVVEQSLDLDFDVMLSDLAPVDLLLQRAGRMHRHVRERRPEPLVSPRLLIARPGVEDSTFDFGSDTWIYDRYVLLRSYLALRERDEIELPGDTEVLIESVYGEDGETDEEWSPTVAAALEEAWQEMEKHRMEEVDEALKRLVPESHSQHLLKERNLVLEEDSPEMHRTFRALTRLGPPSVPVVCLHGTDGGLALEPDGSGPTVDLDQEPGVDLTARIARHTIDVRHGAVFHRLVDQPVPRGWRDHPLLEDHRAVVFNGGVCPLPGTPYALRLSREFGLEIEKETS
jgi:CRISPR-associated endonuclease/helicase Cas3